MAIKTFFTFKVTGKYFFQNSFFIRSDINGINSLAVMPEMDATLAKTTYYF